MPTTSINRGMSMEAIAALLGHHSLDMTRRYARLHDKTLQRAYFDVTDRVDALYDPAATRNDVHAELRDRLLGNGRCSRPRQLPCDHDLACENCVFRSTCDHPMISSFSPATTLPRRAKPLSYKGSCFGFFRSK